MGGSIEGTLLLYVWSLSKQITQLRPLSLSPRGNEGDHIQRLVEAGPVSVLVSYDLLSEIG